MPWSSHDLGCDLESSPRYRPFIRRMQSNDSRLGRPGRNDSDSPCDVDPSSRFPAVSSSLYEPAFCHECGMVCTCHLCGCLCHGVLDGPSVQHRLANMATMEITSASSPFYKKGTRLRCSKTDIVPAICRKCRFARIPTVLYKPTFNKLVSLF